MTNEELKKEVLDAYKRGYEEALNDCVRNGGEAWARSMFANNAEHIKPQQADTCPTCGSDCNERDELTKAEREIERLRSAPARREVQREREAICSALDGAHWLSGDAPTRIRVLIDELELAIEGKHRVQLARRALEGDK